MVLFTKQLHLCHLYFTAKYLQPVKGLKYTDAVTTNNVLGPVVQKPISSNPGLNF